MGVPIDLVCCGGMTWAPQQEYLQQNLGALTFAFEPQKFVLAWGRKHATLFLKSKAWPIMAQNGVNGTCTRMTGINVFFMLQLGDSVVKGADQCQGRLVKERP